MLLSPYLFEEKPQSSNFESIITDHKTWYLWSQILEMGTAQAYVNLSTSQDGIIYFIVDPSVDGHPFLKPEEFIEILSGHEENGRFWGYSWTIREMDAHWRRLIYLRYEETNYSVNDYALKIDYVTEKLDIVPKAQIWKSIEEISF